MRFWGPKIVAISSCTHLSGRYFRSTKPHSGKLCHTYLYMHVDYCWLFVQDVVSDHLICLQKVYRINIWLTLSLSIQNDFVLTIFRNIMNWTFFGIRGDNLLVVFWTTIMKHQRQLASRQIMYRVSPKMLVLGWILWINSHNWRRHDWDNDTSSCQPPSNQVE